MPPCPVLPAPRPDRADGVDDVFMAEVLSYSRLDARSKGYGRQSGGFGGRVSVVQWFAELFMDTTHITPVAAGAKLPRIERRYFDRSCFPPPSWLGQRIGAPEEVERLKEALTFSARRMAELRRRNEQLMAINSDLRWRLGEMTLKWVDACTRLTR